MKKILCSFAVLFALASCATVPQVQTVEKIVTKEVKVEVEKPEKSWASCDYKEEINQGICIFNLADIKDKDDLTDAASLMVRVTCEDQFVYTPIAPLPNKEHLFYSYFKCKLEQQQPEESGKSL